MVGKLLCIAIMNVDAVAASMALLFLLVKNSMKLLRRNDLMKTVWIDAVTHIEYDDYEQARDAVMEHVDTDDYRDALEEVISEYGIAELLKGFIHPDIGARFYEEIMNSAERIVLENFLVEDEEEEED
jgi:hypothetical protein